MSNLEKKYFIIFRVLIYILLIISTVGTAFSQSSRELNARADSLYAKKRYDEAHKIYEELFNKQNKYSPKMLIRMAMYEESMHNIGKALYYLNTYYQFYPTAKVQAKMLDLASQNELTGYEFNELDKMLFLFKRYYSEIIFTLLTLMLITLLSMAYNRWKRKPLVYRPIFISVLMLVTLGFVNFTNLFRRAVVINPYSVVKEGPSAGSKPIGQIPEGNRLFLLDNNDVWVHTTWKTGDAYIHRNNIAILKY